MRNNFILSCYKELKIVFVKHIKGNMNTEFSNKILYISDNLEFKKVVSNIFKTKGLSIENSNEIFNDLDLIKGTLKRTKKISFLRQNFIDYIKDNGIPKLIILPLSINMKPEIEDNYIVLKTFLLTAIALSTTRHYENMMLNIILVFDSSNQKIAENIKTNPSIMMKLLKTGNETLNAKIQLLQSNIKDFNKLFSIEIISENISEKNAILSIPLFIQTINTKLKIAEKLFRQNAGSISNEKGEPADAYFFNNEIYIKNGKEISFQEISSQTPENEITLKGLWNSTTNLQVANNIRKTVKLLKSKKIIQKSLTINLPDNCKIDGSTTASLIQLIVSDFSNFDVIIHISKLNNEIASNSKAYSLLKKHLRHKRH